MIHQKASRHTEIKIVLRCNIRDKNFTMWHKDFDVALPRDATNFPHHALAAMGGLTLIA